ncbi:MAG TPA: primosomal protein N' [Spirochaetota bacterium]|nr:primosomal protein N' [Spirochaetota bacterium]
MISSRAAGPYTSAEVHINTPVNKPFTYRVPAGMRLEAGMRAIVNFRGRKVTGYVTAVTHDVTGDPGYELKDVIASVDESPVFDERLISLVKYVSGMYFSSVGEAFSKALPSSESSRTRGKAVSPRFSGSSAVPGILTLKQREIFEKIESVGPSAHLIYGITGSGKTEIYINMARSVIAQGKSVIYLVPEISLSSQIYERLHRVFGDSLVLYHSMLSPNRRLENWMKFQRGEAKIAIGTRSAVFMQAPELGLMIIDEEQDGSYKEQSSPRYSARHIAFYRAKTENAHLILGSATPSVETLYAAERGGIALHTLDERYGDAELPGVEIVRVRGAGDEISSKLKLYTKRAVSAGGQAVYLLNRRGFSPLVMCEDCGAAVECSHCSISMNYHRDKGMLCHYCGSARPVPEKCGACGSESMVHVGSGTQKIEEIINTEFPGYRVFRLDQDTARRKEAVPDLIDLMEKREIDILLGTQMVSKGFDFPGITLAGILLADIGMNMPDFRASERIVSLLIQLAGRSGRGGGESRVVIQTFNEEHAVFRFIKNHDYTGFYRSELEIRKALGYPPFGRLARILVRGRDESVVIESARELGDLMDGIIIKGGHKVEKLGPSGAPFTKIGGNYRYHMILKASATAEFSAVIREALENFRPGSVYVEVDIDPVDML